MSDISKEKIVSNVGWSYAERISSQLVSIVVGIVLARILQVNDYGTIAIITVFINLMDIIVIGGFGNALVQKKNAKNIDFNTICWFSILFAVFLYVMLYIFAPTIADFYQSQELVAMLRVMGIKTIFASFNSIQHAYVQKKMQFRKFFVSTLGGTVFSGLVGIVLAYLGFGAWALVAQQLTNSILNTILLFFIVKWKPKLEFSFESFKSMFGFGFKQTCASLINTLKDDIRSLVIGKVFSKSDLGFYDQGKKYPALLMNSVIGTIQKVSLPVFSEQQDQTKSLKITMRKVIRISSLLLLPLMMGFIGVAENFVIVFLTEKWLLCVPFLQILSIVYLTRPMNTIFQSSLLAVNKSGVVLAHETIGTIATLAFIAISTFVFESVLLIAWSSVLVMIIGTVFYIVFISKYFKYTILEILADFMPSMLVASAMALLVWLIGKINITPIIVLALQIVLGMIFYVLICKLFRIKEFDYCFNLVKETIGKFKSKRK